MKKMKNNLCRCFTLCLAVMVLVSALFPAAVSAEDAENRIVISSVSDFEEFVQKSSLDAWSQGKTFSLEADLDLTHKDIPPVPTFGGIFEGNGHTIWVSNQQSGSHQGLFRYVQESGTVQNLHVQGNIVPEGSGSEAGGIAGNNAGQILDCSFSGSITGQSSIGGIVGINESTGRISRCTASGSVQGEHYTGGIAGQNLGAISQCVNKSRVNTVQVDYTTSLQDLQLNFGDLNSTENLNTATDTGGIAGYSTGVLEECSNEAMVGYPHIGYNTGGIAGRSAGRLENCHNTGTIYGRKDVGGICGQMVPNIILQFSPDTLDQLETALSDLQNLTDSALNHAEQSSDAVFSDLNAVSSTIGQTREHTQSLADEALNWGDQNINQINQAAQLVSDTISRLAPLMDDLSDVSASMDSAIGQAETLFDSISELAVMSEDAAQQFRLALADMRTAGTQARDGLSKIRQGLSMLKDAADTSGGLNDGIRLIAQGAGKLAESFRQFQTALDSIGTILDSIQDWGDLAGIREPLQKALSDLKSSFEKMTAAFTDIQQGISQLDNVDWAVVQEAFSVMAKGLADCRNAADSLSSAAEHLSQAMKELKPVSQQTQDISRILSEISDTLGSAFSDLDRFFEDAGDLLDETGQKDFLSLQSVSDEYRKASDSLFSSLTALSGQVENLKENAHSASSTAAADIRAINEQLGTVTSLLVDTLRNEQQEPSDIVEDTSEEDIDAVTMGKAKACENQGEIAGDVNVGGIAGSMAVEYDFDPEDDLTRKGTESFHFHLETKAILQNCVNRGKITGKKDHTGSIVGLMDLGIVLNCEGYGSAESTSGSYVGGIAGKSSATIRGSSAKCSLSGSQYVGGIAGYGAKIQDCRALVSMENTAEFSGAIAGDREPEETMSGNYFVSDTLAGIDGVSYQGIAEPMDYESFIQLEGLPEEFQQFQLVYRADGKIVDTVPFSYGEDRSAQPLPEIPAKNGCYAAWEDCDYSHLTFSREIQAVYTPYITTIASKEMRDEVHSLFLVQGNFDENASLTAEKQDPGSFTEQWLLKLEGVTASGDAHYTVRFTPPEGTEDGILYAIEDGKRKKIPYTMDGSYLVFPMTGTELTLGMEPDSHAFEIWLACAGGAVAVILVILIIRIRKRRKKAS